MTTLHERIAHVLDKYSPTLRHHWVVASPILNTEGTGRDIAKVNRLLRVVLGELPINTTDQRECLYETHDAEAWLDDFEQFVVPLLAKYNVSFSHSR